MSRLRAPRRWSRPGICVRLRVPPRSFHRPRPSPRFSCCAPTAGAAPRSCSSLRQSSPIPLPDSRLPSPARFTPASPLGWCCSARLAPHRRLTSPACRTSPSGRGSCSLPFQDRAAAAAAAAYATSPRHPERCGREKRRSIAQSRSRLRLRLLSPRRNPNRRKPHRNPFQRSWRGFATIAANNEDRPGVVDNPVATPSASQGPGTGGGAGSGAGSGLGSGTGSGIGPGSGGGMGGGPY